MKVSFWPVSLVGLWVFEEDAEESTESSLSESHCLMLRETVRAPFRPSLSLGQEKITKSLILSRLRLCTRAKKQWKCWVHLPYIKFHGSRNMYSNATPSHALNLTFTFHNIVLLLASRAAVFACFQTSQIRRATL